MEVRVLDPAQSRLSPLEHSRALTLDAHRPDGIPPLPLPPADLAPLASTDVFTFRSAEDIERFQVTTDRVVGGRTEAVLRLKPYKSFSAACFEGIVDRDDEPNSKGGFAAFRTKADERTRDLSSFEGVEMRVKTDGRG